MGNYFKIYLNDCLIPLVRKELKPFHTGRYRSYYEYIIPQTKKFNKSVTIIEYLLENGIEPKFIMMCSETVNPLHYTKRQIQLLDKTLPNKDEDDIPFLKHYDDLDI